MKQKVLVWLPYENVITSLHNLVIKAANMEASQRDMDLVVCAYKNSESYTLQEELADLVFDTRDFPNLLSANDEIAPSIIYCEDVGTELILSLIQNPNTRVVESRKKYEAVSNNLWTEYGNLEQYISHSIAEKIHSHEKDAELGFYSWESRC